MSARSWGYDEDNSTGYCPECLDVPLNEPVEVWGTDAYEVHRYTCPACGWHWDFVDIDLSDQAQRDMAFFSKLSPIFDDFCV